MQETHPHGPYVLSIAGLDPSAGAGLVADAKAIEAQGAYGLTVATAITAQHESRFETVHWLAWDWIQEQIEVLLAKYPVQYCKIGLIENWDTLSKMTQLLKKLNPDIRLIVDPIFRASAGFEFHQATSLADLKAWLSQIYLLTPNALELAQIGGTATPEQTAQDLAAYCHVLYKGGHRTEQLGADLYYPQKQPLEESIPFVLAPEGQSPYEKHGSGCVLSAAIAAQLALGKPLLEACQLAKTYTYHFLLSSPSLLGWHFATAKQTS